MTTHRTPVQTCPSCTYKLDAATNALGNERSPVPGDISICGRCGTFLKFGEDLSIGVLPDAEFQALGADEQDNLRRLQRVLKRHSPSRRPS